MLLLHRHLGEVDGLDNLQLADQVADPQRQALFTAQDGRHFDLVVHLVGVDEQLEQAQNLVPWPVRQLLCGLIGQLSCLVRRCAAANRLAGSAVWSSRRPRL